MNSLSQDPLVPFEQSYYKRFGSHHAKNIIEILETQKNTSIQYFMQPKIDFTFNSYQYFHRNGQT